MEQKWTQHQLMVILTSSEAWHPYSLTKHQQQEQFSNLSSLPHTSYTDIFMQNMPQFPHPGKTTHNLPKK